MIMFGQRRCCMSIFPSQYDFFWQVRVSELRPGNPKREVYFHYFLKKPQVDHSLDHKVLLLLFAGTPTRSTLGDVMLPSAALGLKHVRVGSLLQEPRWHSRSDSCASDPCLPVSRIPDPETPTSLTPIAVADPGMDAALIARALSALKSTETSARYSALASLSSLPLSVRQQLALALLPATVWPVRPPVLIDGDRSVGNWLEAGVDPLHNAVYDVVGPVLGAGETAPRIGCVKPLRVEEMRPPVKVSPIYPPDTSTVSCAITFVVASGSSVVLLRGLVPVAITAVDAPLQTLTEVTLTVQLAETSPHHNLIQAQHVFTGSSALLKPWLPPSVTVPDALTYLVLPYYPITLGHLTASRHATGRVPLTEIELLMVMSQTLSAVGHMLDYGYVHRNVSVSD